MYDQYLSACLQCRKSTPEFKCCFPRLHPHLLIRLVFSKSHPPLAVSALVRPENELHKCTLGERRGVPLHKCRAYFNVQLVTICSVVRSTSAVQNVQLLHCQLADCHILCSCKSCLKYVMS